MNGLKSLWWLLVTAIEWAWLGWCAVVVAGFLVTIFSGKTNADHWSGWIAGMALMALVWAVRRHINSRQRERRRRQAAAALMAQFQQHPPSAMITVDPLSSRQHVDRAWAAWEATRSGAADMPDPEILPSPTSAPAGSPTES